MKNCIITLYPSGKEISCEQGTLILDALNEQGISLSSPCGGRGICGRCRVRASGEMNARTETEKSLCQTPDERLACLASVEGNVSVEAEYVPETVMPVEKGSMSGALAFAVDIGTTSVELAAVDMETGRAVSAGSFMNPQRRFGHDVVSRISAAGQASSACIMTSSIRKAVFVCMESFLKRNSIPASSLKKIVISANTVMSCLFAGIDVSSMGIWPYVLPVREFPVLKGRDVGWDFPDFPVCIMPPASAYVGGDITAAMGLAEELYPGKNLFFADLGTNGEMFLRKDGKFSGLSCAMGPALEGMNISCGMTAGPLAASAVELRDGRLYAADSQGRNARGLSGTGIIDLLSFMKEEELVAPDGSFIRKGAGPFAGNFTASGFSVSPFITFTQKDVRNIQLAKGACLAGAELLLKRSGTAAGDIVLSVTAGALGLHLNMNHFDSLGFLPAFPRAERTAAGNTSLKGAVRGCQDSGFLERTADLARSVRIIEPAADDEFNDMFMDSLNLEPVF